MAEIFGFDGTLKPRGAEMKIDTSPTGGITPEGLGRLAAKHPQWAEVVNKAGEFARGISDVNQAIAKTNYTNARLVYDNNLKVAGDELERSVAAQAVSKNWDDETYAKELDNAYAQARKTAAEQVNNQFGAGTFSDKGEYIKDKSFAMNEANVRAGEDAAYAVKKNEAIFNYKVARLKTQTTMGLAATAQNYDNFTTLGKVADAVVEQNEFMSPVERVTGVTGAMTQARSRWTADWRANLAENAYGPKFESDFSAALAANDYQKAGYVRDDSLKKVQTYYTRERQKAQECCGAQLKTITNAHEQGKLSDTEKDFLEASVKEEYHKALRESAAAERKDVKAVYNEETRLRQLRNQEIRAALQTAKKEKTLPEDDTAANVLRSLDDQNVPTISRVYNGRYEARFKGMTPEQKAAEEARIEKNLVNLFGKDWATKTPKSLLTTALLAQKSLDNKDPYFYEKTVLFYDVAKFALGRVNTFDENGNIVKKGSSYIAELSKHYKANVTKTPKYDTKQAEALLKAHILQKHGFSTFAKFEEENPTLAAAAKSWLLQRLDLIGEAQDEEEAQMLVKQSQIDYDKFSVSSALLLENKRQLSGDGYTKFMLGKLDEAFKVEKRVDDDERKYNLIELNALEAGMTREEATRMREDVYYRDKYKELTGEDIAKALPPAVASQARAVLPKQQRENATIISPKEIYTMEVERRNKIKQEQAEKAKKAMQEEDGRKYNELVEKMKREDPKAYEAIFGVKVADVLGQLSSAMAAYSPAGAAVYSPTVGSFGGRLPANSKELLAAWDAHRASTPEAARIAELKAKLKN